MRKILHSFIGGGILAAALLSAASAQAQVCVQLENELAALDRGGVSQQQVRQFEEAVGRQRYELDRTVAYSRSLGCGRVFLFGPAPSQQCRDVERRIEQQRTNLDRLMMQLQRARAGDPNRDARRRQVLAALSQNRCGPQYQVRQEAPPPQRRGLFDMLFGGGGGAQERVIEPTMPMEQQPSRSQFRTVCVRLCDGFFFPVSYSTSPAGFAQDEAMCQKTCPGTAAALFTYPNPGGDIKDAISTSGQPYPEIENAFRYQREFVKDCSCKPAGMDWAQALEGAEDRTLRQGDIVVDENRSREMSRPR